MRSTGGILAWVLGFALAWPVQAAEAVLFADGREMLVAAIHVDGDVVRLALDGGGEIAVPRARVSRWDTVAEDPPAAFEAKTVRQAPGPWWDAAGPYAGLIQSAADAHALDPALLTAVAQVESAFDPRAVSPKGACGLLQLMPATADRFGVEDVFDAEENVHAGARYLSWLLDRFEGRTDLALAGYNAGEGAVDRYEGIPPYRETRAYVTRVLQGAARLARR